MPPKPVQILYEQKDYATNLWITLMRQIGRTNIVIKIATVVLVHLNWGEYIVDDNKTVNEDVST